ncbi:hypothetical protein LPH50_09140 [Xylella taiwanensis]|uniref:DNA methyltransferase n=1 Tax=Xylella taiwanensis TaxID=1444770 RepID=Z9JLK7_9GAMM|nr:hypothetical protein [Xylella taiwanensis]EWS78711.1 hypothetical protein AF72_03860 [Xylella taiwanensis]MCD8456107.1 hypothetical protein [Xylella taiwanensis]MCD8458512.1 hypothetical protein [Xylella taiwanensis]MCD8460647.1 hypothetical protein [Xylella taiwanensis]MCD8463291.1 hypothetical protein [Xylella taiwanensis]
MIKHVLPALPRRALIYLDPPYYVKGAGLYEHHYSHDDHVKISNLVATIQQPWLVSDDNVPQICSLYQPYRQQVFGLRYSAQSRYEGSEVMIFSRGLNTPESILPSRAAVV